MRIVFFGTAEFAVPSLEALARAGHEILAVVSQPDKPQGRGMQVSASPVKKAAERLGLPILQPRRVRAASFVEKMREMRPDALALAAFGQIIPQDLLDVPLLGPINVHGSLLPKYRGAAPIQRAIMAGDAQTGVTTMRMEAALDTGDMLLKATLPIGPDDTSGTLFPKLAELGAALLLETLEGLANGTLPRIPQDDAQATLAPMITAEDSVLNWKETAGQIDCRIRGLSPRPGVFATIEINGQAKRVKIWNAKSAEPGGETERGAAPGTILAIEKNPPALLVAAGNGTVARILEAQPENGKRMAAAEWARGARLKAGDRFL